MSLTVDYVPIANGIGANAESQADYLTALAGGGSLVNGYQAGLMQSAQWNKTVRQSSMISAALANFIATTNNTTLLDDGDLAALIAALTTAIQTAGSLGAWSTGDVKPTFKNAADAGWVFMDDGTIGDASSGGSTRANADCLALFTLLWNNVQNTWAPVVGGRGVSAAADWAAHKKITLPAVLGRALAVAGAGAGLTARSLGQNLGEETHILSTAELAAHNHTANVSDPGHTHTANVSDPTHNHTANVSDPTHNHTANLTDPGHNHVININDPTHSHGVSDSGHTHGVNDPGHAHANRIVVNGTAVPNTQASVPNNSDTLQDTGTNTTGITIAVGTANVTAAAAATGVTSTSNGHVTGATVANVASATGVTVANVAAGTGVTVANVAAGTGVTVATTNTGAGSGHNNMQPTTFLNIMIKL